MWLPVKVMLLSVGFYASVRLSGIAIEWLRELFERLRPHRKEPWE